KGCVYLVDPMIDNKATVLMTAATEGKTEPVTWVRDYQGSRIFYTSLGHPDDFNQPQFNTMLTNGIFWAMNRPVGK
ncbi:MAG: ThuA domain-containing protein, partial [Pirellulales bacterium]|nr:ThuA domain-containing protein [Pirellulales bacterium]